MIYVLRLFLEKSLEKYCYIYISGFTFHIESFTQQIHHKMANVYLVSWFVYLAMPLFSAGKMSFASSRV